MLRIPGWNPALRHAPAACLLSLKVAWVALTNNFCLRRGRSSTKYLQDVDFEKAVSGRQMLDGSIKPDILPTFRVVLQGPELQKGRDVLSVGFVRSLQ